MPKTNMFDPNNFTEGGGGFSLAGVEGVVVSSLFKYTNWAKQDGSIPTYQNGENKGQPVKPSTIWELVVKTDDLDDPIRATIGVSGVLKPSKDGVTIAKDLEGPFLVHSDGKDANLNKASGAAVMVESLVNCSFDFQAFNEQGVTVLEGYRLAFDEIQRKDKKGGDLGKPTTVVTKIVHGPGKSASAKKGVAAVAPKGVVKKGKAAPPPPVEEEVEEETAEVDAETLVTEIITEILSEESPLPVAKVSMKVNKKLQELGLANDDRMAALKMALSPEFLAAGPWGYDKKSLAAL